MANAISYNDVISVLKDIATRHHQINTFFLGQNWDLENDKDIVFPLFQVHPTTIQMPQTNGEYKTINITMDCKIVDLVRQSQINEQDVHSDCERIAQDIINEINQHPYYINSNVSLIGDIQFSSLEEFEDDFSAGWQWNMTLRLINHNTFCGLPFSDIPGFSFAGPTSTGYSESVQYLTCSTVTGCTVLQNYIQNTINNSLTGGTGGGFSGWTGGSGIHSIIVNNGSVNIAGNYSVVAGYTNKAGSFGFIGNGANNGSYSYFSSILNGHGNFIDGASSYSSLLGGNHNQIKGSHSLIGNGYINSATTSYSSVLNGKQNIASGTYSFIGSGARNSATTQYSVVVGGANNLSNGAYSFLGAGFGNKVNAGYSSVLGGKYNTVNGMYSSIAGGLNNLVTGNYSVVLGGRNISATTNDTAFVPGLNIGTVGSGTAQINLGIDANGFVVTGSTAVDIRTTGFTYNDANVFTIANNTGGTFSAIANVFTGATINGTLSATTGFINTATTNVFSSSTLTVTSTSNLYGNIFTSFSGSTTRVVEAGATGALAATKDLIDSFLSAGTTATLLSTTSNWNASKVYTGTSITATYQGQQYYDANYYFVCVDDNDWIRIPRI